MFFHSLNNNLLLEWLWWLFESGSSSRLKLRLFVADSDSNHTTTILDNTDKRSQYFNFQLNFSHVLYQIIAAGGIQQNPTS